MTVDQIPITRFSVITRITPKALLKQSDKELIKMALSEPVIKYVPALRVVSKRDKGSYDTLIQTYKDIYEYMIKKRVGV